MSDIIKILTGLPSMVQRGIFLGILTAVAAALLGVTLVLKRYSMIGDGLSHVAFGAMSIALVLGFAPLTFAIPVVIAAAFLLMHISRKSRMGGDSAIALVSSTALALGIAAVSLAGGVNTNVNDYMFGSIVAISKEDMYICVPVLTLVIVLFVLLYNRIFAVTFDEGFAKVSGVKTEMYNMIVAILTAVTVVIGMRIMGTLLISGLIIFPALSSMRLFRSYKAVIISSVVISCLCFIAGTLVSIIFETPVGASIVIANAVVFTLFTLVARITK
ncbi:MAG: metal ABC transporter permease [Clostridia bacterium]|nr:metal ABC transporter permease [Clostridia bacterium]